MKTCVFIGPTMRREAIPARISCYGPVALGSVYRAVEAGYRRIGIVDGVFGNLPAVWHKEILFAMSAGAEVSGAASMGALRAAELADHGMIGLGRIYRMFRRGAWSDDDEVCVVHAPAELEYEPMSDAMADIRFTLRALRSTQFIDEAAEQALVRRMKAIHFSGRTREGVRRQCIEAFGGIRGTDVMDAFDANFIHAKLRDAQVLVARLADPVTMRSAPGLSGFQRTRHWRAQFERELDEVPALH
jgi:hypothetical protein